MKMNRIVTMLPVQSMRASVAFYAKLGFQVERSEEQWGWAMLRYDECQLMVDESINLHQNGPRLGVVYLYPEDIVAYHAQVRKAGLAVPDLKPTFYGMIEFRLEDPDGNRLWIGQAQSTPPPPSPGTGVQEGQV